MKHFPTAALLLFLVLLLSTNEEIGVGIRKLEAKLCQYHSETFHGVCVTGNNCNQHCLKEHFEGGRCHGIRHYRCVCYKTC
ncbi:defensin Tk-AMP-D6-like [Solanum dulcamara]|uniref:defensin Tk-AMP-D6-like n=1 Tax=Solanum dulcamara TaxID=45834 RepID=UPI0024862BB9|nr:defensin Tk-AMP-D6-like [Solanum dulcamara]